MSRGFELLPPEQRAEAGYETAPGTVRQRPRRVLLPVMLFLATCYTTYIVGGIVFAAGVMTVLLTHELGHFIQAVRYRVPASLPYFIPMPYSPIGTMGAVIAMQPGVGDRRSIFDIGITGPLAGLVPALVFSIVGLQLSDVVLVNGPVEGVPRIGAPLLFKALSYLIFGPGPANRLIDLHPLAYAGWVGVFITALNLVPIGQLDGGHVLYCLLLKRAHGVAQLLLFGAMAGMVIFGYWQWIIMIFLLMLVGPIHPPTANDGIPLGTGRTILGWASLLFVPLGFTPVPFM